VLKKDEFERWIEASHAMFEIFEGRYDAYPLSIMWIKQWFDSESFTVNKEHLNRISVLVKNLNYEVYGVKRELKEKIDEQFKSFLGKYTYEGKNENVGFAIALYLFTWNFQRFKEYFRRRADFEIGGYFESLSKFLKDERKNLESFKNRKLVSDQINRESVGKVFYEVNSKLKDIGIRNNEPVGTIKLLHAFAPYYFPLIDNDIAKTTRLLPSYSKWESLTSDSYLKWMNALKRWLQHYLQVIENLENKHNSSILKLVDEGLYMMSTVKQRLRVAKLGIEVEK